MVPLEKTREIGNSRIRRLNNSSKLFQPKSAKTSRDSRIRKFGKQESRKLGGTTVYVLPVCKTIDIKGCYQSCYSLISFQFHWQIINGQLYQWVTYSSIVHTVEPQNSVPQNSEVPLYSDFLSLTNFLSNIINITRNSDFPRNSDFFLLTEGVTISRFYCSFNVFIKGLW